MKTYLLKLFVFSFPVMILAIYTLTFYQKSGGDLSRMGKISVAREYREDLQPIIPLSDNFYDGLQSILNTEHSIDILTLGDSFSQMRSLGYQNHVASSGKTVLNIRIKNPVNHDMNPFITLELLLRGDFFDKIKPAFVIVEVVERHLVGSSKYSLSPNIKIPFEKVSNFEIEHNADHIYNTPSISDIVKFPLNKALYYTRGSDLDKKVYVVNTTTNLFSNFDKLVVLGEDVKSAPMNNSPKNIARLHQKYYF